ncbi:IS1404 transposase [Xanthomonas oryzae pv. oryzae KACC 10331]|uniref:IS1404 transposase n=1 Tax=Xanthomonas oryzae pv. oryzae (strain KACC10331 / KXO85) TaxID=291331 RepID=Q5H439_XANOR|nr:IS1404 transposase [Xanthomonas oryzae pv. oryzae KACC 10331]
MPVGERAPLLRPTKANQVWSMDVVFDRTAEGRAIKCLVIVDDATQEAVAIDVGECDLGTRRCARAWIGWHTVVACRR